MDNNFQISIIIPVKNESENIVSLVDQLKKIFNETNEIKTEIIIVDDSSTDDTKKKIEEYIFENNLVVSIKVINNLDCKHSVGKAIRLGIVNSKANNIITMDGDLSHKPEDAIRIYNELIKNNCDFVVGGRYLPNQEPFSPLERYKISRKMNSLIRFFYCKKMYDYTTGFRGFSKDLYNKINLKASGFEFHLEINIKLKRKSKKFKEIPIRYIERVSGTSKLKYQSVFIRYLYRLFFSYFY